MPDPSSQESPTPNWPPMPQPDAPAGEYEAPRVLDLGHVRELTGGSSSSGTADANSQYYW
jgi:hypothetical protein